MTRIEFISQLYSLLKKYYGADLFPTGKDIIIHGFGRIVGDKQRKEK